MIIVWGSRNRITEEGQINFECIICKEQTTTVCSYRSWFTFFFIPIFPTGSKKYYISCTICENSYKIKDGINIQELLKENTSQKQPESN